MAQLVEENPNEYFVYKLEIIVEKEIPLYSQDDSCHEGTNLESKPQAISSKSFIDQLNELKENFKEANSLVAEAFK